MHARLVRSAAVVAVAAVGTLTWAPAARAEPTDPLPSASAAPAETPALDTGSVEITAKDTAGDVQSGAAFLLLDSTGQEAGHGQSGTQGTLTFPSLAPGVYRLKQTSTGDQSHEAVADQDVIVTPGATTRLTITDPFKAAAILLQVKDDKTGKLLRGATVNIGTGTSTLLTLTTGPQGTASGELPVSSRTTEFWAKETTAPAGHDLDTSDHRFEATSGERVTVTLTNSPSASPSSGPSGRPTIASPSLPGRGASQPPSTASASPEPAYAVSSLPRESLAHTGAGASPWLLGGAALLVAVGSGAVAGTRRRSFEGIGETDEESAEGS
ncbi:SpaA isopeptide-forming pilin-related protein [Actinacidiphila sp. bgisy144]|uniref:MSCRAMM family protein n=1 Tax=Actinacidiphila sp. bgisy144 TaxID=3413791 RepID=UPI003EBC9C2F